VDALPRFAAIGLPAMPSGRLEYAAAEMGCGRSFVEVLMAFGIRAARIAALLSTMAASAEAQDSTYRSAKAHSGQRLQLSAHFTLKRDCSASPAPEIRVITAPSNGTLSIRAGAVRSRRAGSCSNIEAPARIVFYQSNVGYTGPDQVTLEVKKADGSTEAQSIAITVEMAPTAAPGPRRPGGTDL